MQGIASQYRPASEGHSVVMHAAALEPSICISAAWQRVLSVLLVQYHCMSRIGKRASKLCTWLLYSAQSPCRSCSRQPQACLCSTRPRVQPAPPLGQQISLSRPAHAILHAFPAWTCTWPHQTCPIQSQHNAFLQAVVSIPCVDCSVPGQAPTQDACRLPQPGNGEVWPWLEALALYGRAPCSRSREPSMTYGCAGRSAGSHCASFSAHTSHRPAA